ncbi:hypothetical protein AVEN_95994-1 [Araneus ventricosus]|uniref:Uncharacterized protein n=1 Tax=Araneus ventricosus TaxID=182803 RepID=A0A4Y2B4L3_ARAVE|nr:hypothetical protein AVEN_95994-1 [Araneus ventricosus]
MHILEDNVGCARMKNHSWNVFRIVGVDNSELDVTGLTSTNLTTSKFVLVVKDQFAISESQIKSILRDTNVYVDGRKEIFVSPGNVNVKEKLVK